MPIFRPATETLPANILELSRRRVILEPPVSFGLSELPPIQRTVERMEIPQQRAALTKLLVNVTVEGTLGPVHVVMSPEDAVVDLIREAVEEYVKEGRRPLLQFTDPKRFELHYSQYSLERLDPQEKLIDLGSRNFFLCSIRLPPKHKL